MRLKKKGIINNTKFGTAVYRTDLSLGRETLFPGCYKVEYTYRFL